MLAGDDAGNAGRLESRGEKRITSNKHAESIYTKKHKTARSDVKAIA